MSVSHTTANIHRIADEPEARMLAHERRHDRDHRRVGEAAGGPAAVAPAPAERRGGDERAGADRRRDQRRGAGERARRQGDEPAGEHDLKRRSRLGLGHGEPFEEHGAAGEEPQQGEDPAADRGRKQSHEGEHKRRRDPQPELGRPPRRSRA